MELIEFLGQNLADFWSYTGFANATPGHIVMLCVGLFFIWLAIKHDFEPLLLVPIGFGILVGNIPFKIDAGLEVGIYEEGSVLNILYNGVSAGWYPPLIFLGIGAMTDFSALIANPKLMLIGAAAQFGIFGAYIVALAIGFAPDQAAAIAIIGGADGPTAIFLSSKLAPNLMGAIAVSAYSYMALVPVIQPPVMRLLTTKKERLIRMEYKPASVSKRTKILFPILVTIVSGLIAPASLSLVGMLMFGNLIRECGVLNYLTDTAKDVLTNLVTLFLGITIAFTMKAENFITVQTLMIMGLGLCAFIFDTFSGVMLAKVMNLFLKEKINPMIGAAGISAFPMSARIVQKMGIKEDPTNHLLMHAVGANVSGQIASAIVGGLIIGLVL